MVFVQTGCNSICSPKGSVKRSPCLEEAICAPSLDPTPLSPCDQQLKPLWDEIDQVMQEPVCAGDSYALTGAEANGTGRLVHVPLKRLRKLEQKSASCQAKTSHGKHSGAK